MVSEIKSIFMIIDNVYKKNPTISENVQTKFNQTILHVACQTDTNFSWAMEA